MSCRWSPDGSLEECVREKKILGLGGKFAPSDSAYVWK
jgi:hypothetical protein